MISYHGKEEVKAKYVRRMREHQEADRIVQRFGYWLGGKGCAVGCTLESDIRPHAQYPIELGLPEWLAHLEDHLFENLPEEEAASFALDFLQAIPVGVNELEWNRLRDSFQIFWLELQKTQIDCEKYPDVSDAIDNVIYLLREALEGHEPNWAAWARAGSEADLASCSAFSFKLKSSSLAVSAAESAADSASRLDSRSVANSASRSTEGSKAKVQRDWLLPEMKRLKVKEEFRG